MSGLIERGCSQYSSKFFQILLVALSFGLFEKPVFASPLPYDDASWKEIGAQRQRKTGDDLRVFISSVDDSPVMAFKVDGTLNAPLPEVATLVLDLEQQINWVPELNEAKVISCLGPNERLEYYHIVTPPFVQDRDFLLKTKVQVDRAKRALIIESHSVEDPRKAPVQGRVRGVVHVSKYTLTALDSKHTRLQYFVHVDPMGDIAKWLVNFAQKAYPKRTVRSLKRRLQRGGSTQPAPELFSIFRIPSNETEAKKANNLICGMASKPQQASTIPEPKVSVKAQQASAK